MPKASLIKKEHKPLFYLQIICGTVTGTTAMNGGSTHNALVITYNNQSLILKI